MPLSPGTRLGPYDIVAPLGARGMGEVYRARDSKLNRDVALKVLPEAFARDAERMTRFDREAQVLASLNHPNIASIYGLEESGGLRTLVMELVDGPTLADRIAQGPIPFDEALPIAKQIAEALEFAHEKGIIHRDLKPANIKVTPEGKVKVLDFGLAKALWAQGSGVDLSQSPTAGGGTRAGTILGTAAYMSPEQARGNPVDKRTDIWAFGCVLYEMVTGRQPFRGETGTDTLAAVIGSEPDWDALPGAMPPQVRDILRHCLQKKSAHRLRDIGDARIEIEELLAQEFPATAVRRSRRARWAHMLPWGLAAALVAGLTIWSLMRPTRPVTGPVRRLAVALPATESLAVELGPAVILSPDGTRLVYVVRRGGNKQLYLRDMDRFVSTPIPHTEGGYNPFFSPDGRWIGFFADHKMKKISVDGGTPLNLCDVPVSIGASWGPDDTILFTSSPNSGLSRISASGGTPEVLTTPDFEKGEIAHYWPEILPDGKTVLFTIAGSFGELRIAAQSLQNGERRNLIEGGNNALYVHTGHLVFARAGTLLALPFDLARLRVTGQPVQVLEDVANGLPAGAQFSLSREGALAYISGSVQAAEGAPVWVDRQGRAQPLTFQPGVFMDPRLSPDGLSLALVVFDRTKADAWGYDLARGAMTRLTFSGFENETPVWMSDSKRVAVSASRATRPMRVVFLTSADGRGAEEQLWTSDHHLHLGSCSPDGRWLAFTDYHPITGGDIWVLSLEGERRAQPYLQTRFHEWGPRFSPDGRWLAYVSNESGRDEVYVQAFPGPGSKRLISTEGGSEPVWARNGRELFYRNGDKMMAVDIATKPAFSAGRSRLLFEGRYRRSLPLGHTLYDVAPDAQRFLMVKESEQQLAPVQVNIVLNFFDELRRRVPVAAK